MATPIDIDLGEQRGRISGYCDAKFEPVMHAFVRNFRERAEIGASLCFNLEGETVVDLWGGRRHPKQDDDWQRDTISYVASVTKAAVSVCAHLLIHEGRLKLHEPVTTYWPEFGQNGKENITVAMMLNHSAGLAAFTTRLRQSAAADWNHAIEILSAQAPLWKPGTRNGYHMATYGFTVGELIRRASGQSLGEFFRDRVAQPLGLDFHIGLPPGEHHRVSRMIGWAPKKGDPVPPFTAVLRSDRDSISYKALMNNGPFEPNERDRYSREEGSGGGITNARGIAGLFNPLANGGGNLVDELAIERMGAVSVATQEDATLMMPSRFSLGFMVSMDNRYRETGNMESIILGKHAFGHAGAGGSVGFADTECHLGFGYSMNRMGAGIALNERGQSLIDATYRCLGYRTDAPGYWIR